MNLMNTFGRQAAANGFHVLPVAWGAKYPATWTTNGWRPEFAWGRWSGRFPTDLEFKHWNGWPTCSVGIATGHVMAIDLDLEKHEHAEQAARIAIETLGETNLERVGRRPRKLRLYRSEGEALPGSYLHPLPVQILGTGSQFVAAGMHPSGRHYQWLGDDPSSIDVGSLPAIAAKSLEAFRARMLAEMPKDSHDPKAHPMQSRDPETLVRAVSGLGAGANLEAIKAAMEWLPNNDETRDLWIKIAIALKAAVGNADGWPFFQAWSAKSTKYDKITTAKTWLGLKPTGALGAGTVFKAAMELGWRPDHGLNFATTNGETINIEEVIAGIGRAKKAKANENYGDQASTAGGAKAEVTKQDACAEVEADNALDRELLARVVKPLPQACLYGPLADAVAMATKDSEATAAGVCLQIMAQTSLFMRPFRVEFGDDRAGLNIFTLQLGASGFGRKGTSSAFADRVMAPGLLDLFKRYEADLYDRTNGAATFRAQAGKARAERDGALAQLKKCQTFTPNDLGDLKVSLSEKSTLRDKLEEQKALWQEEIKSQTETRSPRWYAEREKAMAKIDSDLDPLVLAISRLEKDIKGGEGILADRERAAEVLKAEATEAEQRKAGFEDRAAMTEPAPWELLFASLAHPAHMLTGVSSGEGLIDAVRDERARMNEKGEIEIIPGNPEKRVLLNLSEFGSVLTLVARPGNTLSAVLRNLYDCMPVATNAKNNPVSCAEPFFSIAGSCTPREFVSLMFDPRDKTVSSESGLANRFIIVAVARDKLVPIPARSANADPWVERVFENLLRVYLELRPVNAHLGLAIELADEAAKAWTEIYTTELQAITAASPRAAMMFPRLATNARKLAGLLALLSGESRVSAGAIRAAFAWITYSAQSINDIVANVQERLAMDRLHETAGKVMEAIRKLCGASSEGTCTQRDIRRELHLDAPRVAQALAWLASRAPSPIDVRKGHRSDRVLIRLRDAQ